MDTKVLDRLAKLSRDFAELYNDGAGGICGVYDEVHLTEFSFFDTFSQDIIKVVRDGCEIRYEYSTVYDGVKFFCISEVDRDV